MKIAVCGLIGSGKSEVLKLIKELGYTTINLDKINENLIEDKEYVCLIKQAFPTSVIDGKIDKLILSSIIFNNNIEREKLNSIAHPIIKKILNQLIINDDNIYFIETPLLIEAKMEDFFDKIIYIEVDYETQIDRIVKRNNITREIAIKKISSQLNELKAKSIADLVINNNNDFSSLKMNINAQIEKLIK